MTEDLQDYLDAIATDAPNSYRDLLWGISDYYRSHGRLSDKQIRPILISARKQNKPAHPDLQQMMADTLPPPAPAPDDFQTVITNLLHELASVFQRAAQRLR